MTGLYFNILCFDIQPGLSLGNISIIIYNNIIYIIYSVKLITPTGHVKTYDPGLTCTSSFGINLVTVRNG